MRVVTEVNVIRSYLIEVTFDDGRKRRVDLEPLLQGEIFQPLKDPALFAQVQVDPVLGTVVWPNGADLSPEFLYAGDASTTDRSESRTAT